MEQKRKKVVCGYYLIKIYNDTDTNSPFPHEGRRGPGKVCSYVAKNKLKLAMRKWGVFPGYKSSVILTLSLLDYLKSNVM